MSSKEYHGESHKKSKDFSVNKHSNGAKSRKNTNKKKINFPTHSSSSEESPSFYYEASSKSVDNLDLTFFRSETKKHAKEKSLVNTQQFKNVSAEHSIFNDKRSRHNSESPKFRTKVLHYQIPFKQTHRSDQFYHGGHQRDFIQSGAKPKIYNEQKHHISKPVNHNIMHLQENIPRKQENIRQSDLQRNVQGLIHGNQHDKNIYKSPVQTATYNFQQNASFKYISYKKQVKSNLHTEIPNSGISCLKNDSTTYKKCRRQRSNYNKQKQEKVSKGYSYNEIKAKRKAYDFKKKIKEPDMKNVVPLLTFQSLGANSEKNHDLVEYIDGDIDDDDDWYIVSQNCTDAPNVIDFSDASHSVLQPFVNSNNSLIISNTSEPSVDNTVPDNFFDDESDCDSPEGSEESDLTSEYSIVSSILDSETKMNYLKSCKSKKEAFVSVFWDIENCTLPQKKSAVDFASYIRDTFYEGRTEVAFTAACDVSNLNNFLVRDLDEAAITLVHISSLNKNAADKKIMSLLQRFQTQYRKSNSAIVLISSDSDFSQILLDMRYQHHIFVNLICKSDTRDSLTMAANKYMFLDDVLNNLPNRNFKNIQHVVNVSNLPKMKVKVIKRLLSERLRTFNCRLRFCNNVSVAKIYFKDYSVCLKAMNSLKGLYLGGNTLIITYHKELQQHEIVLSNKEKKKNVKSLDININEANACTSTETNIQINKELNANKGATLCIIVSMHSRDAEHWKTELQNMWNMTDFSVDWDGYTFDGCFLIKFKSLKQAQKAKKILQKNQMNDPNAPKFLKLIKSEDDLISLKSGVNDIEGMNKEKIEEHLQIIEKKKLNILRQFGCMMTKMKSHVTPEISGTAEAVDEKLRECKEQIETFNNFCNRTTSALKNLSCNSKDLNEKLKELLCDYIRECNCIMSPLPIYSKKEDILRKIKDNQIIVICTETGSGKSTQLPQYIWREKNNFQNGKIICIQRRKIAAISLAKHLSSQTGSSLGDIVGYQTGMYSKMSANTKILYVTDITMLKILVSEDLDSISCIIIDDVHERTIYTDILLGVIKKYVLMHPQLRVVITSAISDTSLFRDFFALTDNEVLHIPGRNFPVIDEWLNCDTTPTWDYFNKTVDKAFELLREEPGDVLAFLVTPLETEKAFESFTQKLKGNKYEKNVKVFCLHEKMNPEEQQKVFQNASQSVRRVIFATNCAETSISIPGIKYVIDCGLTKEPKYDAVRNVNIFSIDFISKSSAEQRRGRTGRTQVGKCFHLYSKDVYNCMISSSTPEILRINLGLVLLKLLKMGVKDPLQFDFIQSPPKELIISALDQLLFLKAVDNNFILTDLGKNMAALPFEPYLSHLIFQSFDNDVGYDALVIAASLAAAEAIFVCNSGKIEDFDKKRRFCEYESDFISYLEVYKEWVDVPKPLKSQWCVINCINSCSMHAVHELVNEAILILQKDLNFKFKLKFKSDSATYDTLTKIIFSIFSQNLSVFSGHPKLGYMNLNIADKLVIHPSSFLSACGQPMPQFVVFDSILRTTQAFIPNVSPVTKDMIFEAIKLYDLKIDLKSLENLTASELSISPLGVKVIFKYFIGRRDKKRMELQDKIKELTKSDFVEIDIDVSKGCIKFISFAQHFDKIESLVSSIIDEAKQSLLNEQKDICLCEKSQLTAILVAGGHINDVVLPGEFRDIKVTLKGQENIESVCEKLSLCGSITAVQEWKKYFKVTFSSPVFAKKAFDTYKSETEFSLQGMYKCLPVNERDCFYKVYMNFYRRPCMGVAYISVEPKISALSLPSSIIYENISVRVTVCKKTQDIRITDLPVNTNNKKLESLLSTILPLDVKIIKFLVIRKKPYESTKEEVELIKKRILDLFAEFTSEENITVDLKKPGTKYCLWNAVVCFKNFLDGESAVNVLKNRKHITNFPGGIVFKPRLQTFLHCKAQIFSVVKEKIVETLEVLKGNQSSSSLLNINAIPKDPGTVEIQIISDNVHDIADAARHIYKILKGDELKFCNSSYKVKLFSNSGKEMLKKLSLEFQDCYILQNEFNKTISLFGKEISCDIIKMLINEFLNNDNKDDVKELSLKTNSGKVGVLKELLKTYGYDLQKLKEDCGISDVEINKYKKVITILGNSLSIVKCESIIQEIKENLDSSSVEVKGEICPVCCDEVSEDNHRLEYCGHAYCIECLLHLFQSYENIPLNCELCQDPIVMADILWAINGRKILEKILFKKFLQSFVDNRSDVSFCPSQGCVMIFRVTKDEMNVFRCPSCGNIICTRCEELFHFRRECNFT